MQRCQVLVITTALFLMAASHAYAENNHTGQGYVFFAPGATVDNWGHLGTTGFGGGGEALLFRGFGLAGDAAYIAPWRSFSEGIGMISLDGSYHFLRNSRLSPFVTAGYSLAVRGNTANLVNFGGGVNWWFADHFGFRLEFRDQLYSRTDTHFMSGRIGFSFR